MGQTTTVIRLVFLGAAFFSPFFFPIGITMLLTLVAGAISSFAPFAIGLLLDALYWSPSAYAFPFWSVIGALASIIAFFVHRFLETSIMRAWPFGA